MKKQPDAVGGNGDIYFDIENNTATKFLRNTSSKERIERFRQEQRVLQEISNKNINNIVQVLDIHIDENNIKKSYITMKKYDGSLSDLFDVTRGNPKATLKLLLPVIKALKELSQNIPNIYHRDLKPDNILYLKKNNDYELFLTDFGTCFLKEDNERITPQNIAVGARMFLAPEYELGRVDDVNEKGDIYSIGKIIWCMINGEIDGLLPSNFWFIDEFNLSKKFHSNIDIMGTNLIIASCLNFNPEQRCSYDELINKIKDLLNEKVYKANIEEQYRIEEFQEKRKIELIEKNTKNKLLVNSFSCIYLDALKKLVSIYPKFDIISKLYKEYSSKPHNGMDYTTRNVTDNSYHYLYRGNYDCVYLSINYRPESGNERYANITLNYIIKGKSYKEIIIKYDEKGNLISEYKGNMNQFNSEVMKEYIDDLIKDYIENCN